MPPAVLQRRAKLVALMGLQSDVATVGGVKITEPAADLAVAMAVSATLEKPLPNRFLAFGEVGLAGEVRAVSGLSRRLQEAQRLGFTHAIVPRSADGTSQPAPEGMAIRRSAPWWSTEPHLGLGLAPSTSNAREPHGVPGHSTDA